MDSLTGQLIIAMPQLEDPFFARSLAFICSHTLHDGAMGLIVNRTLDFLTTKELFAKLNLEIIEVTSRPELLHFGGPVETDRALVLHSADYRAEGTIAIGAGFALTGTSEVLRAIAKGEGPQRAIIAVGYAGWAPGQLEREIRANGWLLVAADISIVFDTADDAKWEQALAKIGVTPALLSGDTGRA
jgi:putative transcriptional regulator